jgi:DNA-binding response OmpR family regulator
MRTCEMMHGRKEAYCARRVPAVQFHKALTCEPAHDGRTSGSLFSVSREHGRGVLVVDENPAVFDDIREVLAFEGLHVTRAADGPAAIAQAQAFRPDVVLLGAALPKMSGFEVCHRLRRERPEIWIIMLTAWGDRSDGVRGIETGADDFVTKPCPLRELTARIRVGLRRTSSRLHLAYAYGDVELDPIAHRVRRKGREVQLTPTEFRMLEILMRRPGEVITRDEFLDAIWGRKVCVVPRVVDTHMAALRRKLEVHPGHPSHLHSIRGIGYRLDTTPTES